MWVFTKNGFYSAIEYQPHRHPNQAKSVIFGPAEKGSHILVRSRVEEDMEFLAGWLNSRKLSHRGARDQDVFDEKFAVARDDSADYMFRLIVPRVWWAKFLDSEAMDIDYGNFKSTVKDAKRHSVYMSVWSALLRLQPLKRWRNPRPLFDSGGKLDIDAYIAERRSRWDASGRCNECGAWPGQDHDPDCEAVNDDAPAGVPFAPPSVRREFLGGDV